MELDQEIENREVVVVVAAPLQQSSIADLPAGIENASLSLSLYLRMMNKKEMDGTRFLSSFFEQHKTF